MNSSLLLRSPQGLNALREYELVLRGNKLKVIENLGVTRDQFDCIDLSDNDISTLEGFPTMIRLKTILINNNRIGKIAKRLGDQLPNLQDLVLTGNRIAKITVSNI